MKRGFFSILLSVLFAFSPLQVRAADSGIVLTGKGVTPAQGQTVKTLEGAGGTAGYTPSTIVDPMPSRTEGMQNNAQDASKKQKGGNAAALAALAAMLATMAATCPNCPIKGTCGICAAAGIGAAASGLTAGNMSSAKKLSDTQKSNVNPTLKPESEAEYAESDPSNTAKKINQAAANSGMKISPDLKTITMPDGDVVKTEGAFTSGAGLSSSEQAALKDMKAKAADAAQKAALAGKDATPGADEAMGVAGGGKGSSSSDTTTVIGGGGFGVKRDPAAVAGAFKDFNGDKIGVASDSMFSMIKRRYNFESERNAFVMDK